MIKDFDKMKQTLKRLCAIPSVQGEPLLDMPFGKHVREALDFMLDLGKQFGFKVTNYDGYIGEIVWEGAPDEQTLGILCHLDVVKAGRLSDWKTPPFEPIEQDGKIIARGTLDDKGPAVSILYMMKQLKEEGFIPKKTIKFILGCNEESGWGCIDHYLKVAKMPDFGFSPDGNFPVLYAEKGIMHVNYSFNCDKSIKIIEGGEMSNMVCDYAYAIAPKNNQLAKECGLTINGEKIESFGVSAHGSTPEKGKNAIDALLKYLTKLNLVDSAAYDALFNDCYRLKEYQDETGPLTMSPNIIRAENGVMQIIVDFRYPATFKPDFMEKQIARIAPFTLCGRHQAPLFNDKNSFLIKTLLNIYNKETNSSCEPIAIGGGTYARALPIGVAFGPEFPGADAPVHEPNEYISLDAFEKMSIIYKQAIKELSE